MLQPGEKRTFVWPNVSLTKSVDYCDVVEVLAPPAKLKKKGGPLRFLFDFTEFNVK